jgi:hypothetical protein
MRRDYERLSSPIPTTSFWISRSPSFLDPEMTNEIGSSHGSISSVYSSGSEPDAAAANSASEIAAPASMKAEGGSRSRARPVPS